MKHLHFVQSMEPLQGGGLGQAATDLHGVFRSLGSDSRILATGRRSAAAVNLTDARVLPRLGPEKAFFAPELFSLGRQWTEGADVVHGHGFYVSTNWILGSAARRSGKALVLHPHGMLEPWILRRSRTRKKMAHLLFENANFRSARLWRALTSQEADQIRARGIEAPIVVAPNGVDPAPFDSHSPKTLPHPKKKCTALFLGRLHPKKGIDLLIEAFAALPRRKREEWSLLIAGPDEGGHRAELVELVRRLSLEDSVTFPGLVTGSAKINLMREADLFVLSSHSEGFSVAILEAMAARLPVLASKACNFSELFARGGGWECDATLPSVTEALNQAFDADESERTQRGEAGRRLLEERYTWESSARILLDACEQHCR